MIVSYFTRGLPADVMAARALVFIGSLAVPTKGVNDLDMLCGGFAVKTSRPYQTGPATHLGHGL